MSHRNMELGMGFWALLLLVGFAAGQQPAAAPAGPPADPTADYYCIPKVDLNEFGPILGSDILLTPAGNNVHTEGAAARLCAQSCTQNQPDCIAFQATTNPNPKNGLPQDFTCRLMKKDANAQILEVRITSQTANGSYFCAKGEEMFKWVGKRYAESTYPDIATAGREDTYCLSMVNINGNAASEPDQLKLNRSLDFETDQLNQCRKLCRDNGACLAWVYQNNTEAAKCMGKKDIDNGLNGNTGPMFSEAFDLQFVCYQDTPDDFVMLGKEKFSPRLRYMQLGSSYYTLYPEPALWDFARRQCQATGGDLATIDKPEDLHALNSTLMQYVPRRHEGLKKAWIGYRNATNPDNPKLYRVTGVDGVVMPGTLQNEIVKPDNDLVRYVPVGLSAYTHMYLYSAPPDNVVPNQAAGVFVFSANGTHEKFPFICKSPVPVQGAVPVEAGGGTSVTQLDNPCDKACQARKIWVPIVAAVGGALLVGSVVTFLLIRHKKKAAKKQRNQLWDDVLEDGTATRPTGDAKTNDIP